MSAPDIKEAHRPLPLLKWMTAKGIDEKEAREVLLRMVGADGQTTAPATVKSAATEPPKPPVQPRPLGEILDAVTGILRRYVVFPMQEQVSVIAAWILHTWVFDAFDYTAYLFVFSAAKRSGKSRVLEVIEQLAKNPMLASGSSSAALTRSVDEASPSAILLDEVDTIYSNKNKGDAEAENIRRFLNAGYRRGAKFLKCVGQSADIKVVNLSAFCPKALAGIDRCLPDTVMDRSLPIELVRQSREEKAERFREREVRTVVAPIRAELEALAQQKGLMEALRAARPELPEELNDRVQDITEPLIAIADLAGGEWPERLRSALVRLCAQEEDADTGVKLLKAIKAVFDASGQDKLSTRTIIEELVANADDAPWAYWFEDALKHDRMDTAASKLARVLKGYKTPLGEKIKPRTINLDDGSTAKGYHRIDFTEAWKRMLPPASPPLGKIGVAGVASVTNEEEKVPATTAVTPNPSVGEERDKYDRFFDPDNSWGVYPGNWIHHDPKGSKRAPDGFPAAPKCEVCGDSCTDDHSWSNLKTHAVRCQSCQETDWWTDGYEIDDWGMPSSWNSEHTREKRIAERERNFLQKHQRFALAHPDTARVLPDFDQEIARLNAIIDPQRHAQEEALSAFRGR